MPHPKCTQNGDAAWVKWTDKAHLVDIFQGTYIQSAEIPYAARFGVESRSESLDDFIRSYADRKNQHGYIFEQFPAIAKSQTGETLWQEAPRLNFMSETDFEMQNLQFCFGANHSGSPMHFHRDAINVLIQGKQSGKCSSIKGHVL